MKVKVINRTLKKVHEDLCKSISDPTVRKLVEDNTIITGGCITSMLLQEPVNDYDLYFRNIETVKAVANYYVDVFKQLRKDNKQVEPSDEFLYVDEQEKRVRVIIKSAGIIAIDGNEKDYQYFEQEPDEDAAAEYIENVCKTLKGKGDKYRPILITSNAITLSNNVQLIIRFFGEPDDIFKNYDFVHCTNYWTSWSKQVVTNPAALECILARELKYVGSLYPLCSLIRLRKFIKRGWSINAGQIVKMAFQASELDLSNPVVLEEQLTGVDFAYFQEVIRIIKEENPKDIDSTYISEILDRVFGK
jgi:hypothetical protein